MLGRERPIRPARPGRRGRDLSIGTEGAYTFEEVQEREAAREAEIDAAEGRSDLADPGGYVGPCAPVREIHHRAKPKKKKKKTTTKAEPAHADMDRKAA